MNRNEAVTYLKELLNQCKDMSPDAVSFQQHNQDSAGYSVRIKGALHPADKLAVKEIARKFRYEVTEDPEGVVIYNPI